MTRALVTMLIAFGLVATAHAQKEKKGAAELLFKEGKRLMDEGNLDEACPKFEESQRLDPAIGTLLNLARCYETAGKTASAWQAYVDAAAMAKAKKDKRAQDAQKRANTLEPKVPRLVIDVKKAPAGVVVLRDGGPIDADLLGVPVPADPGATKISATAPGYDDFEFEVDLVEGETTRVPVTMVETKKQPDVIAPIGDDGEHVEQPPDEEPPPEHPRGAGHPGRGRKILGIGVGVVGLAGLGTSIALGLAAKSAYDAEFDAGRCNPETLECDATGAAATDDARSQANLATIVGGVGIAAIVVGVVLYLTAPDGGGAADADAYLVPVVGADQLGLAFGGTL